MAPHRAAGGKFDAPFTLTVPVGDDMRRPRRRRIGEALRQRGEPYTGPPGPASRAGRRGGAGSDSRASSRGRVTTQTWVRTASSRSIAEKPLSATATMRRSGNHRATCNKTCRAPSTSDLWRTPRLSAQRCDGISTVRNGSAQTRRAHGTGTSSIADSQRKPLALTK